MEFARRYCAASSSGIRPVSSLIKQSWLRKWLVELRNSLRSRMAWAILAL
jgi:hypothetical protein